MNGRTALVVGASGLVGGHLLDIVSADATYARVIALVRRRLDRSHEKLEQRVVDFDTLFELAEFPEADDVFCALGTTIRNAGSQEAFARVDYTYVFDLARTAAARGARQFLLVSSMGADSGSRIFYNRVKGEIEEAVSRLQFSGIHIFRPSVLTGDRKEFRLGERLGILALTWLRFAMVGPLRRYRAIAARDVAAAMVAVARKGIGGTHGYESDRIQELSAIKR